MIGDIVGSPGMDALASALPAMRLDYEPDFVIANGENQAGGRGIAPEGARRLLHLGVDVITSGNHAWKRSEIGAYMEREPRLLRPANYPPGAPGAGSGYFIASNGATVFVANFIGRALMEPLEDPFRMADTLLGEARVRNTVVTCIDFHAETTSEKQAFGLYVDGRASMVVGTHTHVQTADERVLPGGTAYITDVGMCGPQNSVIGMNPRTIITRFLTQRPQRFDVAEGPCMVSAVLVTVSRETGFATSIERLSKRDIEVD